MTKSWRISVNRFLHRTGVLRRRWEHLLAESINILVVTTSVQCRSHLRVAAVEHGWRILFAETIDDAIRLQCLHRVTILVYDQDLPEVDWRDGLAALTEATDGMFPIVLSHAYGAVLRREVIERGGYDVAKKPPDVDEFAALVHGALTLADGIESSVTMAENF